MAFATHQPPASILKRRPQKRLFDEDGIQSTVSEPLPENDRSSFGDDLPLYSNIPMGSRRSRLSPPRDSADDAITRPVKRTSNMFADHDIGSEANTSIDQQQLNSGALEPTAPSDFFSPPSNAGGNFGPRMDLNDTTSSSANTSTASERFFLSPATTVQLNPINVAPTPSVSNSISSAIVNITPPNTVPTNLSNNSASPLPGSLSPLPAINVCPPSPVKPTPANMNHNLSYIGTTPRTHINIFSPMKAPLRRQSMLAPPSQMQIAAMPPPATASRYFEDFEEIERIGRGSFGDVLKCWNRIDGWVYAIKKTLRRAKNVTDMENSLREVYALAALGSHPHILRYYRAWIEDAYLFIQMEYCPNGSVGAMFRKRGAQFTERMLLRLLKQVAKGLKHIHSNSMVHLDIKPDNIFVFTSSQDGSLTYKIGDFGLISSLDASGDLPDGDGRYLAPEILNQQSGDRRHLQKADMYSLGCTMLELATDKPLESYAKRKAEVSAAGIQLPSHFSTQFTELIRQLLDDAPERRPSAAELLRHPLLRTSRLKRLDMRKVQIEAIGDQLSSSRMEVSSLRTATSRLESENAFLRRQNETLQGALIGYLHLQDSSSLRHHQHAPSSPFDSTAHDPADEIASE